MKRICKNNQIFAINASKFKPKRRIFAFFLIMIILLIFYIIFFASPLLIRNVKTELMSYSNQATNSVIFDVMNNGVSYDDLINISKSETGDVLSIDAKSSKINSLSKSISIKVFNKFLSLANNDLKVSLGAFSGIAIFSNLGPKINFGVHPFGEVFCDFVSSFESAGINQTYHRLYFDISLKFNVVFPFKNLSDKSSSKVLISETIIVGKIPEVYLSSGSLSKMLNLVPENFSS